MHLFGFVKQDMTKHKNTHTQDSKKKERKKKKKVMSTGSSYLFLKEKIPITGIFPNENKNKCCYRGKKIFLNFLLITNIYIINTSGQKKKKKSEENYLILNNPSRSVMS